MGNEETTPSHPRADVADANDPVTRSSANRPEDSLSRVQRFRRQLPWAVATLGGYWLLLAIATHLPLRMAKRVQHGDKIVHALAYAGLTFALFVVLAMFRRIRWQSYALTLAIVAAYAAVDEILQGFVPFRAPDFKDWCADMLGAVAALAAAAVLHRVWTRRRTARRILQRGLER